MPDSMRGYLQQEMECEGLLECFHGLRGLDREVFGALANAGEGLTVDEIAETVDRERSTAYRSVQRLLEAGLLRKEQINYSQGGYCHVYRPVEGGEMADEMQRMLNDWYAKMGQLIQEFEDKYEGSTAPATEG
jgi:predicted transcriptional regulator